MKQRETIGITIIIILAVCLVTLLIKSGSHTSSVTRDSQLTQVIKRGEIRCSYIIYSPLFRKDPNTGEFSGIFHDLMEEIGKRADLKINWVEEVGYENIFAGLENGRHDVFAGGLWPNANRAKVGAFSIPVFYSIIKAWGRADETRFVNLEGINSPDVRIATIDGALEDMISRTDYPPTQGKFLYLI